MNWLLLTALLGSECPVPAIPLQLGPVAARTELVAVRRPWPGGEPVDLAVRVSVWKGPVGVAWVGQDLEADDQDGASHTIALVGAF